MCTVSWLVRPDGYELYFNRDELRTRKPAEPPRIWQRGAVRFLAPVDGEAGGTWLAVNEFGLTVGLLNLYGESVLSSGDPCAFKSRGFLVEHLAASANVALLRAQLAPTLLKSFRPFTLVALTPSEPVWAGRWDGERLTTVVLDQPLLSSSGYDAAGAEAARRELWRQMALGEDELSPDHLLSFHCSHQPERGPFSPCMHRDDARTVSFARVVVSPDAATMSYADGPPCSAALGRPEVLLRRAETLIATSPT